MSRVAVVLLVAAAALCAGDADTKLPAAADKAYRAYVAAIAKAVAVETTKVEKALATEQDKATRAGKLEDAMAIKGLLAEVAKGKGFDDAKASGSDLLAEKATAAQVRGWASVSLSGGDWVAAPLREGATAVLNTKYVVTAVNLPVPKGSEVMFTQVPQYFQGPLEVTVTVAGKGYVASGLPLDRLLAMLPKEVKPQAASASDFSAPGVLSVAMFTAQAGSTFTLQGHEVRVIAGVISR
jgi:hypothetical protein